MDNSDAETTLMYQKFKFFSCPALRAEFLIPLFPQPALSSTIDVL